MPYSSSRVIRALPALVFVALASPAHRSARVAESPSTRRPVARHASAPIPKPPPLATARGAFIGLSVANLDASVRWYSEKLGLEVVMRPPKIEKSTAVILEGGGLIVELMHHDDAVPLG